MINIFITTGSPSTPPPPSRSILARGEMRSEFSFSTFFHFSICVLLYSKFVSGTAPYFCDRRWGVPEHGQPW